jgi:hypothetical protein
MTKQPESGCGNAWIRQPAAGRENSDSTARRKGLEGGNAAGEVKERCKAARKGWWTGAGAG